MTFLCNTSVLDLHRDQEENSWWPFKTNAKHDDVIKEPQTSNEQKNNVANIY